MDYLAICTISVPMICILPAIWKQTDIRWKTVTDDHGRVFYQYPALSRNIAGVLLIVYTILFVFCGAVLTFEITGQQERSKALFEFVLMRGGPDGSR